MKSAIITQSNYIPWKGYFAGLLSRDVFVVYDDMQYTRRDWRNRNIIKTATGPKWLTIPVEVSGKYFQKIRDTRIADKSWAHTHWNALKVNYKTSACFKDMKEWIEPLYLTCTLNYLTDVNMLFIQAINSFLGINTEIILSSDFDLHEDKTMRLVNICRQLQVTDYYTGPAAKAYMEEDKFAGNGISVHYFDYSGFPVYEQQFPPFEHGVTILDTIFNVGINTLKFMQA